MIDVSMDFKSSLSTEDKPLTMLFNLFQGLNLKANNFTALRTFQSIRKTVECKHHFQTTPYHGSRL